MAKVELGPIVTDVRGTTKEVVWTKTGKSGIGAKSQAGTRSNPQSEAQAQVRLCVTLASRAWNDELTQRQRDMWNALAKSISDQTGEACNVRNLIPQTRGVLSGFNIFLALYVPVCRCNIPIDSSFYTPPIGASSPSAITNFVAAWVAAASPNFSLAFDGLNERVTIGNVLGYEWNQPQSWEFWVYPLDVTSNNSIITKVDPGINLGYRIIFFGGNLRWQLQRLGGAQTILASRAFPALGVWSHCVLTYDGSGLAAGLLIYVNTVVGQVPFSNFPFTGTIVSPDPLAFAISDAVLASTFFGRLDCIRNYNRVVTPVEVAALWNGGAGLYGADPFGDGSCQGSWMFCTGSGITLFDISGNAYHGTLINMEAGDWIPGKVPCPPLPAHISLTWTDPVFVMPGSMIRIWIKSHELGVHKQLIACVALEGEAFELTQVRMSQGVPHDITDFPGHYMIQADVLQPNGLKSPPSNTVEVTVP